MFAFCGLSKRKIDIFVPTIQKEGGAVFSFKPVFPMFRPSSLPPLDKSVSHIIAENSGLSKIKIAQLLNCNHIPDTVQVLDSTWLESCIEKKSLVDEDRYRLEESAAVLKGLSHSESQLTSANHESNSEKVINSDSLRSNIVKADITTPSTDIYESMAENKNTNVS